jgi:plasmid stabilization system protein ParE
MLAADYPFLDVFWTLIVFFLWVMWFWLLITIWTDVFRRDDISGWGKAGWLIFTLVLPFLGAFIYIVSQHDGMTRRNIDRAQSQRAQFEDYVRETAGKRRRRRGDREGEAAARQRRDHASRVRRDQAESTGLREEFEAEKRTILGLRRLCEEAMTWRPRHQC